ncbi:hypothetical protein AB4140_00640 [Shewanella sp. 10N.286.51.B2]|uniref:hypothetical protein n=1 Tax=Shewanella sp. 10N.286.51.B2 TaxID=3229707 RepID=UPI003552D014
MTKSRLQELLNKCDESIPMSEEDKDWDQMLPIGKEWGSGEDLNALEEKIDIELARIIEERKDQPEIEVNIEDL